MNLDQIAAALADRYRIERELGQGGMATVYLAEDIRHRRKVAVKVLRPELAATMGPERFLREIEIAAQLQHPHILPLLDSGESGGFLYYVMPYVPGESLRDRLARERELPVHDAVRLLAEVADALGHAHAAGVVHRDIKPENILLSGRHALVADFGVAKAVTEATGRHTLTSVGVALGTPVYMAPEQAAADKNLDHRVDIYAIGVLAYELLAGRPPFTGQSSQEIIAGHLSRPPEPVRHYRGSVSAALEAVVMRCLEKRPADRWQNTAELVAQLEPLATPSGGMTPASTPPARAPGSRPRWLWGGLAAGLVVLAGAGVMLTRGKAPIGSNHIAALPIQDISGADAQFVDAMHDQLIIALGQARGLTVAPRSAMLIYKSEPKPMPEVARELGVGAILEGTVFRTGDRMRINVQLTEPLSIRQLWSHSYEIDVQNVLSAQDSVVRQIAAGIREAVLPAGSSPPLN